MDTVIAEYQKWKQQGHALRAQDYHQDFGAALKPPASITAFRFKAAAAKAKKGTSKAVVSPVGAPSKPTPQSPLEKKRAQARAKLDAAKAADKPTRNIEDKIYEIEDEFRLAKA